VLEAGILQIEAPKHYSREKKKQREEKSKEKMEIDSLEMEVIEIGDSDIEEVEEQ